MGLINYWDYVEDSNGFLKLRERVFAQDYLFIDFLDKINWVEKYDTILMCGYDKDFLEKDYTVKALEKRVKSYKDFVLKVVCKENEDPKTIKDLINKDKTNRVFLYLLPKEVDFNHSNFTLFGKGYKFLSSDNNYMGLYENLGCAYMWDSDNYSDILADKKTKALRRSVFINDKLFNSLVDTFILLEKRSQKSS